MSRIAIIGGHGKIALRLARILAEAGHEVTSLIRNPDHGDDVTDSGATPVLADVEHLSTQAIGKEIEHHDAVVWAAGSGGGNPDRTFAVDRDAAIRSMDAAVAKGVERYVMISYKGAGANHGVAPDDSFFPYAESKAAADDYLQAGTLAWTILRPSKLTLDAGTGRIEVGDDLPGTQVSRQDVARVAAAVLERPETTFQIIEFNNGATPIEDALPTG